MERTAVRGVPDFFDFYLGRGLYVHWLSTQQCKTLRLELILSVPLRRPDSARLALVARLFERGTRRLPDMQRLHRAVDDLYGAYFASDISILGDRHLLHLTIETLAPRFVHPEAREELLPGALELMRQILMEPDAEGASFNAAYVAQEKGALQSQINSLYNDKMAYAQWRCEREMDVPKAETLTPFGTEEDVEGCDGKSLWDFHRQLLRESEVHLYVSGPVDAKNVLSIADQVQNWLPRREIGPPRRSSLEGAQPAVLRHVFECGEVSQGKLVCGYVLQRPHTVRDYVAMLLLNALWGGEGTSMLNRSVREEKGLCYYIESQVDPLRGRCFVVAGIDRSAYRETYGEVEKSLVELQCGAIDADSWLQTRALLAQRLAGLDDDREGLLRLNLRSHITRLPLDRSALKDHLFSLRPEEIATLARGMAQSACFFLYGNRSAGESA